MKSLLSLFLFSLFIFTSYSHASITEDLRTEELNRVGLNSILIMDYECGVGYWVCPRCENQNKLWSIPYCENCDYVLPIEKK